LTIIWNGLEASISVAIELKTMLALIWRK